MSEDKTPANPKAIQWLLLVVDLLILWSLVSACLSWFLTPVPQLFAAVPGLVKWSKALLLIPVVLVVLRIWLKMTYGVQDFSVAKKLSFAVCSIFIPLVGIEQVFQLLGYENRTPALVFKTEKGFEINPANPFRRGTELLWEFKPGFMFNGRRINSMGHPEREITREKASDTTRIICMGDSVTGQGPPTYATSLHEMLHKQPPGEGKWEAFGMGTHGYSSAQGLALLKQARSAALQPDIVSLYYGWNDHWLAPSDMDDEVQMGTTFSVGVVAHAILQKKRFGQWLQEKRRRPEAEPESAEEMAAEDIQLRVSKEKYQRNLKAMVALIRERGAVPLLISAPRARLTRFLVPKQCISVEQGQTTHDEYVDLTRKVAEEEGVALLDLAKIMEAEELQKLFSRDGIHFHREGLAFIGRQLHEKVMEITSSEAWKQQ